MTVIEEDLVIAAQKRLLELSTQIEQQVSNARKLPAGQQRRLTAAISTEKTNL